MFLLSCGVVDPLDDSLEQLQLAKPQENGLLLELSPLDYFLEFQKHVEVCETQLLRKIGQKIKVPRLALISELDFSKIVGQRLAKNMISKELVTYFWGRCDTTGGAPMNQPLSMMFAGRSGNGKTELAKELAELLNLPGDNAFHKVDCGKMTDDHELFGVSGSYQGAKEGSSLNNFVLSISQEPDKIGVVLLDEIDKAPRGVITGLCQVLDKGEWTNKQLTEGSASQTSVISCRNIIFIMTVNAADRAVVDCAKLDTHRCMLTAPHKWRITRWP
jgi:ATP-dependent Clp protease ATP-binding subunit ClpA